MSLQKEERNADKYCNKAFLFLPVMNSLPLHLYLEARMNISQVFQELTNLYQNLVHQFFLRSSEHTNNANTIWAITFECNYSLYRHIK
jgi:hypothetical protein